MPPAGTVPRARIPKPAGRTSTGSRWRARRARRLRRRCRYGAPAGARKRAPSDRHRTVPRGHLHHQPEHCVVTVAALKRRARQPGQPGSGKRPGPRAPALPPPPPPRRPCRRWQSRQSPGAERATASPARQNRLICMPPPDQPPRSPTTLIRRSAIVRGINNVTLVRLRDREER